VALHAIATAASGATYNYGFEDTRPAQFAAEASGRTGVVIRVAVMREKENASGPSFSTSLHNGMFTEH
jgi:hypothetical protein